MTTNAASGLTMTLSIAGAAVGAGRSNTLTINQAPIDTTSDDSSRWGDFIFGRRDWSVDMENLYIYTDAAQIYLEEHLTAGNPATVALIWTMPDTRTYTGTAIVTSYSFSRNYEDVITFTATLQGTGAIVTSTS